MNAGAVLHARDADLHAWLDAREPAPPPHLRERIDLAIANTSTAAIAIPSALGEAALCALRTAVARCNDRVAAIDLLAADALLTYMMEAAAEQGSGAVRAVADAYGNTRLAHLVANNDLD